MTYIGATLCCIVVIATTTSVKAVQPKEFWFKLAQDELKKTLDSQPNTNVAKNVILAIGDGMGVSTTTAGRVYRGQQTPGMLGEEAELSWDVLPHTGLSRTYTADAMTADSAGSATAYHTGAKTTSRVVGLDNNAVLGDCSSTSKSDSLTSIAQWALAEGKSVGIVTTDRITGGSPAPLYAKAADRDWRDDSELPEEAKGICRDIAVQLLDEENLDIQVLLGGGRAQLMPENATDPEYPDETGHRLDGRNLAAEWVSKQQEKGRTAKFVFDQAGFDSATDVDYLLGTFERGRMQEDYIRRTETVPVNEPSLAEMTERAISILSKNPRGFYLFIEGANIDKGHHENRAHKALEETLALDDAVQTALDMTSTDDTLVVVSADHSHEFSFGGYSLRGESILGLVETTNPKRKFDLNKNRFTVIAYGNGPGGRNHTEPKAENFIDNTRALYAAAVPLKKETHAGEDVAIFASGPMSHLFIGVHEQHYIPHAMAYAACIGENKDHCRIRPSDGQCNRDAECGRFAACNNNVCSCNEGYVLEQEKCVLSPLQGDCDTDGHCPRFASCVNNFCRCNDDYKLDRNLCILNNQPSEANCANDEDCDAHSSCINGNCVCDENFELQNGICTPKFGREGECRVRRDCGKHAICVRGRGQGQNYCKCRRHYELRNGRCKKPQSTEEDE